MKNRTKIVNQFNLKEEELNKKVEKVLREYPQAREVNDVACIMIQRPMCISLGITHIDDMFLAILKGKVPSGHSIVASISRVKKKYPELKPAEEIENRKKEIKEQYALNYRNA